MGVERLIIIWTKKCSPLITNIRSTSRKDMTTASRYIRLAAASFALVTIVASSTFCQAAPPSVKTDRNFADLMINAPHPEYPLQARQRHATGSGIFMFHVDVKSGRVKDVQVARTTGDQVLDAAALTAIKQWQFKPGILPPLKNTNPRRKEPWAAKEAVVKVPVTFTM